MQLRVVGSQGAGHAWCEFGNHARVEFHRHRGCGVLGCGRSLRDREVRTMGCQQCRAAGCFRAGNQVAAMMAGATTTGRKLRIRIRGEERRDQRKAEQREQQGC